MGRLALLAGAALLAVAALALWHAFQQPAFVAGLGLAVIGLLGKALLGPGTGRPRLKTSDGPPGHGRRGDRSASRGPSGPSHRGR
jgi:hypothetical protein